MESLLRLAAVPQPTSRSASGSSTSGGDQYHGQTQFHGDVLLVSGAEDGDFEVAVTAPCNTIVEPDLDIYWFVTTSPVNYGKHKDTVMDDLYVRQSRALDAEERRRLLRQFEKRLYDEEVHFIMGFQWHRIVPHLAKVRGWTITPSHFLNQQLDTVWLSE